MTYQDAHDLWNATFHKTTYACDVLARGIVGLDRVSLALVNNCDGRLPLCTTARALDIPEREAIALAGRLLKMGWITRAADPVAGLPADPLPAEMRSVVRRLRPVLTGMAGPQAAIALEYEARACADAADIIVRIRRRFADAGSRERFTAAAMRELGADALLAA